MKLKELRQQRNLTQADLAKELGVSQKSISDYEKQKTEPDYETLIKIANYFHVTIDSLLMHEIPYLLDKSTLNPECQKTIDKIIKLTEQQCSLINAYIVGMLAAERDKQNLINKYKGDEE